MTGATRCGAAGAGPSEGELGALAAKYALLLALRRARARGEAPPPKATFARLAREHPGALYELDRLPLAELERRAVATAAAARGGAVEDWMRWAIRLHAIVRDLLAARRAAPRAPERRRRAAAEALELLAHEEGRDPHEISRALFGRSRRGVGGS